jgi:hypothetical protein
MHPRTRFGRVALTLALLVAAAPAAQAQGLTDLLPHVAVGGVGSTLGLGLDAALGFGKYIVIRGAASGGSIGVDQTLQSQAYTLFAKADTRSLMLDIHPFGGGIYVSVGKVQNNSTLSLTGTPTNGSYTVNGQSYAADSVGNLVGAVVLPKNPLFFGFGWDHTFGNTWGASITSRLGVLHQDKATLALSATGPYGQASNPAHAQFQAQLDAERANQEASLDKGVVRNMPVVEIGMRVRLF